MRSPELRRAIPTILHATRRSPKVQTQVWWAADILSAPCSCGQASSPGRISCAVAVLVHRVRSLVVSKSLAVSTFFIELHLYQVLLNFSCAVGVPTCRVIACSMIPCHSRESGNPRVYDPPRGRQISCLPLSSCGRVPSPGRVFVMSKPAVPSGQGFRPTRPHPSD